MATTTIRHKKLPITIAIATIAIIIFTTLQAYAISAFCPKYGHSIKVIAKATLSGNHGRAEGYTRSFNPTHFVLVMVDAKFDSNPPYCRIDFGRETAYAWISSNAAKYVKAYVDGYNYVTRESVVSMAFAASTSAFCGI